MIFQIYSPDEIKVVNVNAYQPPDAFYDKLKLMQDTYPDYNFIFASGNNDKKEIRISISKELEEDDCEALQSWLDEYIN